MTIGERVELAIAQAAYPDVHPDFTDAGWRRMRAAALSAMHDPTDAMIEAALAAMASPPDAEDFKRGWRAAIEAAAENKPC